MKLHPSTYAILHFTPWARLRGQRDRFYPLLALLCAVLVMDVIYILRVEAMYRRDALGTHRDEPVARPGVFYGAEVRGVKSGQPQLTF